MTEKLAPRTKVQVILGVMLNLLKKVPRIALFMVSFFAIFWVGQQLYYRFAPAETFLNYYYAKVDDTPVGTEPLATLCRRVSTQGVRIEAVRTFIKYEDVSGKPSVAGEYQFSAGVEQQEVGTNCQNVRLRRQPQVQGTFSAHTEYVFYINGYRKSGSYDTNKYKMTPTAQSLEAQVKSLQDQIDILKRQMESAAVEPSTGGTTGTGSSSSSSGSRPSGSSTTPSGSSGGSTPPTAVQPQTPDTPITPAEPVETCIVDVLGIKVGCTSTRIN